MSSVPSIARSGLRAAQRQLDTTAHNVANLPTEGFHRQQLVQSEQQGGGVRTQFTRAQQPGAALETDLVDQLQAKNAFLANLKVFRTADVMAGSLLDKKA